MSISSIGRSQSLYRNQSLYKNQHLNQQRNAQKLSSGKRINSAADDAAGLAIAQKLLKQQKGLDMGTRNAATAQDMVNVADGGLSMISDSLQRMRELSVQASNSAIYGPDDRAAIQQEISQLNEYVTSAAGSTQFNNKNLLDGTMTNAHVASGPDGSGMNITMPNATSASLGISGYNVTENFDISAIDSALNNVSSARSSLGATYNRLGYTINNNSYTSLNTSAAHSRIEDLDYGKAVSDKKKDDLLKEYSILMQRKQQEQYGTVNRLLKF